MEIERITVFRVAGRDFESLARASDHVDRLVNEVLTRALIAKGFTVSECVKVTDAVLSQRAALAELLTVSLPDDDA